MKKVRNLVEYPLFLSPLTKNVANRLIVTKDNRTIIDFSNQNIILKVHFPPLPNHTYDFSNRIIGKAVDLKLKHVWESSIIDFRLYFRNKTRVRVCVGQSLIDPTQFTLTPGDFIFRLCILHEFWINLRENLLRLYSLTLTVIYSLLFSRDSSFIILPLKDLSVIIFMLEIFRKAIEAGFAHANLNVACLKHVPNRIRYLEKV